MLILSFYIHVNSTQKIYKESNVFKSQILKTLKSNAQILLTSMFRQTKRKREKAKRRASNNTGGSFGITLSIMLSLRLDI